MFSLETKLKSDLNKRGLPSIRLRVLTELIGSLLRRPLKARESLEWNCMATALLGKFF